MASQRAEALRRIWVLARGVLGASPQPLSPQHLAAALRSGQPAGRLEAAQLLVAQGVAGASFHAELTAALQDDEAWLVRVAAAKALGCLAVLNSWDGAAAAAVAIALATGLDDSYWAVREAAAEALGLLGDAGAPQTPALERALLEDHICAVRAAAARALCRLRTAAAPHSAALASALRGDRDPRVRLHAADALRRLSAAAFETATDVELVWEASVAALADPCSPVRSAAAGVLGALGLGKSESALVAVLRDDSDWEVRRAAAQALGAFGEGATAVAASALARGVADGHELVAAAAAAALGELGASAAPQALTLAAALQHKSGAVRAAGRRALRAAAAAPRGESLEGRAAQLQVWAANNVWSVAVEPYARKFAAELHSNDDATKSSAEEALAALGALALPWLVAGVIRSKDGAFAARMLAMRGLSCTGVLPTDLACSFLAEWIYGPSAEVLPVSGLQLLRLQRPRYDIAHNMQWAVLRKDDGLCFLVFRGSETSFDWIENGSVMLREVEVPGWGGLLLHSGYWGSAQNEGGRVLQALSTAAEERPIERLVLCGGSKGGANALALAVWLLLQHDQAKPCPYKELSVVIFGAPNIVGRGSVQHGSAEALQWLRDTLRGRAPRSKSWLFTEDPVPAFASNRSKKVVTQYSRPLNRVASWARWLRPEAFKKAHGYLRELLDLTETLEPLLPEEHLVLAQAPKRESHFDASVHPQLNYTEALCRRLLAAELPPH